MNEKKYNLKFENCDFSNCHKDGAATNLNMEQTTGGTNFNFDGVIEAVLQNDKIKQVICFTDGVVDINQNENSEYVTKIRDKIAEYKKEILTIEKKNHPK